MVALFHRYHCQPVQEESCGTVPHEERSAAVLCACLLAEPEPLLGRPPPPARSHLVGTPAGSPPQAPSLAPALTWGPPGSAPPPAIRAPRRCGPPRTKKTLRPLRALGSTRLPHVLTPKRGLP